MLRLQSNPTPENLMSTAAVETNPSPHQGGGGGHPLSIIYIRNTNKECPCPPTIVQQGQLQQDANETKKPPFYNELKRLFLQNDVNKDGRLSKKELRKAFAMLGSRNPLWRAWLARLEADVDRDGYISWAELDLLISYTMKWKDSGI